jgi:hypothetical protein
MATRVQLREPPMQGSENRWAVRIEVDKRGSLEWFRNGEILKEFRWVKQSSLNSPKFQPR